jgi:hypothetical protein
MDTQTHVLQVEKKKFVIRLTDRRPDDAPLVEWLRSEADEPLTANEADALNRWLRESFDEYRPFVSMLDGKEYFNP